MLKHLLLHFKDTLMKSILLLFFLCIGFSFSHAQVLELGTLNVNPASYLHGFGNQSMPKSTACGLDTVQYPLGKAVGLAALNINSSTSAGAAGQYFDAPQAITISGIDFYAYSITLPAINVLAQIYIAGPDSLPIGAPLASTSVAVDSSFGGGSLDTLRKTAIFTTPVTVSVPYIVVISNNSANAMGLISSAYATADGQQEWLSSLLIGANWLNSYDVNVGGSVFDADWLLHPLVTYDLTASVTASPACITGPSTSVAFTNNSSGVISNRMYNYAAFLNAEALSHTYNFGNATGVVNAVDTTFSYTGPAEYTVSLTDTIFGWNSFCTHDTNFTLGTPPLSAFTNSTSSLSASFVDASTFADSRSWDFGDGNSSMLASPSHTYATPGTYNVCFTVQNNCGSDVSCQSVTVACAAPVADFSTAINGYDVDFTDLSTGTLAGSTWSWDFGDGNVASTANPSHTYAATGTYTVCLIAESVCGSDTICKSLNIVCDTPGVDFNAVVSAYDVDFIFASTVTGTASFSWDFGDGSTSILENPSHTYATAGSYNVCLTVMDICGTDVFCQNVAVVCNAPVANFTFDLTNAPSVDFTSTSSTTGATTYAWDFGDGASATTEDANHSFSNSQISYTVCLSVSDVCGQDTFCTGVDVTTAIQDFSSLDAQLFPNPTSGFLTIELGNAATNLNFSVMNALGQVVFEKEIETKSVTLDLRDLNEGVYFVVLSSQEAQYVQKLILK